MVKMWPGVVLTRIFALLTSCLAMRGGARAGCVSRAVRCRISVESRRFGCDAAWCGCARGSCPVRGHRGDRSAALWRLAARNHRVPEITADLGSVSKRRRRPCRFGYGDVELCVCRCGRVQSIHVHAWRKQMELSRSQPDAAVVRSVGRLTYVQVLAGLRAVGCVMEPITPQPPGQVAVHAVQPHRILPRRRRRRILRHDQNRDRHRRLARPRHRAATSRTGSRSTTSGACTPPSAIKPQPRLAVPARNAW